MTIYHAHRALRSMIPMVAATLISLTRNRIVFSLAERTGNIWMAEFKH
jgi:hypothetical protein